MPASRQTELAGPLYRRDRARARTYALGARGAGPLNPRVIQESGLTQRSLLKSGASRQGAACRGQSSPLSHRNRLGGQDRLCPRDRTRQLESIAQNFNLQDERVVG